MDEIDREGTLETFLDLFIEGRELIAGMQSFENPVPDEAERISRRRDQPAARRDRFAAAMLECPFERDRHADCQVQAHGKKCNQKGG